MKTQRSIAWLAAAIAALTLITACDSTSAATTTASPAPTWHSALLADPIYPPNVTLTDTSGKQVNIKQATAGKFTLLYFGYTHCPDVCPTTMATVTNAIKQLTSAQRAQVQVLFVTTDPKRDTAPVLRAWLNQYNTSFVGLTGTVTEIDAAQLQLSLPLASPEPGQNGNYTVDHSTLMPLFDPDGEALMTYIAGTGTTDTGIADDLRLLIAGVRPSPQQ